jgi:hypothetical protein
MWGRRVEHHPFNAGKFCKGKPTGTYVNDNRQTVTCNNDDFDGGWTGIFTVYDQAESIGDRSNSMGELPLWYERDDSTLFDQYLWVDQGTKLDYARGAAAWTTEGYDTGKHFFVAADGTSWKIKDRGEDSNWSFPD